MFSDFPRGGHGRIVLSFGTTHLWNNNRAKAKTTTRFCRYRKSATINSSSAFHWHKASLKQQSSQSEDDYEILSLPEICNYQLVVFGLSLPQSISETTVEPSKRGWLQVRSSRLQGRVVVIVFVSNLKFSKVQEILLYISEAFLESVRCFQTGIEPRRIRL